MANPTSYARSATGLDDGGVIVATKLYIPTAAPDRMPRRALLDALIRSRDSRLVLAAAPAGSGKTTLLSHWHADPAESRPFAWLSLDAEDNDPVRFWRCVSAALDTVAMGLEDTLFPALRAPQANLTELVLPVLINALADWDDQLVLVLDDYHVIDNREVHRSLTYLLDHLPPCVQLVIASRTDPPLPLARFQARGELHQVRAVDLRLDRDQAARLLNDSLGLNLEGRDVERLQSRTEGWAAGLQLVGLSLRGREDQHDYIASFAGSDRQIVDYLGSEVLDGQPADVRDFLLRTCILDRLSGSVCDAVTGDDGAAAMLDRLERRKMFLIPLDDRREWYRYHHLFGDLLRYELRRTEPDEIPALHCRAYVWYRDAGFVPDAIRHAAAAGDFDVAAELIAANWLVFVNRGELETVEAWTRALPPDAVDADPRLCLARGWMFLVLGRLDRVEPCVRAAEQAPLHGPMRDGSSSVEASAAMLRTSCRLMLGDVRQAGESARRAVELEPDPDAPWRAIACNAEGMTAYWSGRRDDALVAFGNTVPAALAVGNHTARIYALGYMATIHAERGETDEAERLAEEATTVAEQHALAEHWVTIMAHYARADIALRRGSIGDCEAGLARGLELARRGGIRLDTAYGVLALARLRSLLGDRDEAHSLLREGGRQVAECADPGILAESLARTERELRAGAPRQGDRDTGVDDLSERELGVLRLLPTQLSLRQIGDELFVSLNTVKSHARSIYLKLGVNSRDEAVQRARELQLI